LATILASCSWWSIILSPIWSLEHGLQRKTPFPTHTHYFFHFLLFRWERKLTRNCLENTNE
jgi:hypothetical protein